MNFWVLSSEFWELPYILILFENYCMDLIIVSKTYSTIFNISIIKAIAYNNVPFIFQSLLSMILYVFY